MARRMTSIASRTEGSILILTVWTLFFLAALAVAVGSYVSGGLSLARRAAADGYGRAAMIAGVEHASAVLDADTNQWDGFSEDWAGDGNIDWRGIQLGDSAYRIYNVTSMGATNAGLVDEESRINLNKASKPQLEAAFRIIGKLDAVAASSMAAAVVDWRDEDDEISEGGVESGFYQGLRPGYQCANREFETIYELLLVRGITYEVFDLLSKSITVYGSGKININTSDKQVLQALAEASGADAAIAESIASKIVGFRQSGGQFSEASAIGIASAIKGAGILAAEEESVLMRMLVSLTLKGSCFRGTSEGGRPGHSGVSSVEFVYSREKGRILFWNEL